MPLDTTQVNRILGAARARDPQKVEDLWIELQSKDSELSDLKTFLRVAQEVAKRGDKDKAADLLLLLKDDLKAQERNEELFDLLRKAVRYSPRIKGIREDLVEQYRLRYSDRPGLEAIISRTDLAGEGALHDAVQQLDEAFHFAVGEYVFHMTRGGSGWGIGKVVEANLSNGEFVIDFSRRRGHRMEAGMALKTLERRDADDLDVLLWTDKDRVRELALGEPLFLLRKALEAAPGNRMQARDLKSKLADVLAKSDWTKFWTKARKQAKNDAGIEVGPAPKSEICLRDEPLSREDELVQLISKAADHKARLSIARSELIAMRKDGAGEAPPMWLAVALEKLGKLPRRPANPAIAEAYPLETALLKAEAAGMWPGAIPGAQGFTAAVDPETGERSVDPETGEPMPDLVPGHLQELLSPLMGDALAPVLQAMTVPEYRKRVVGLVPHVEPARAAETLEAVLLDPAAQVWTEAVKVLSAVGRDHVVLQAVTKILISPGDYPAALCAFARARLAGRIDILPERRDAEIVMKAIQVLDTMSLRHKASSDRKEKASLKTVVDALRGFLGDRNQRVLAKVVEEGTEDEIRRILQLVRHSPTLTQTIKRATEKFVVDRFPELLSSVSAPGRMEEEGPPPIYSTIEGKRRRERELNEIMEVKMPAISIEIGKALEFGDISENAELDAAREKQNRLAEQATRIQSDLERVSILDPSTVETDQVRVGTRVETTNLDTQEEEIYTLLGPWDLDEADPTIISHLSALAQGLLGCKVGDETSIKLPGGNTARYQVKAIGKALTAQA